MYVSSTFLCDRTLISEKVPSDRVKADTFFAQITTYEPAIVFVRNVLRGEYLPEQYSRTVDTHLYNLGCEGVGTFFEGSPSLSPPSSESEVEASPAAKKN